ncbi:MAG: hypothetical protein Q7U96_03675 [Chloroflexota bacterium]|nr:hypothetical protein [Chloroflexota bacterium]
MTARAAPSCVARVGPHGQRAAVQEPAETTAKPAAATEPGRQPADTAETKNRTRQPAPPASEATVKQYGVLSAGDHLNLPVAASRQFRHCQRFDER